MVQRMKNIPLTFALIILSILFVAPISSQPVIQWQKALGGSEADQPYSLEQTSDGGYVVVGFSASSDGDASGWNGNIDFWVVKLSSDGEIQWQKMLGGANAEVAYSVQQTSDGGYIVAGYTNSNDGDVSGHHGNKDFWVVKLSSTGNIEWQKVLGGTKVDEARSVRQTTDGGYIIAGWSFSTDGDVTVNYGYLDVWVVKLSPAGEIEWQRSYGGGTGADQAWCIRQTSDGGYILAGETSSNDGDVSGYHDSGDFWVLKLSNTGTIEWQRALGGSGIEVAHSIQQTTDGGYVVGGLMSSNNGDITIHHGYFDYWVVKLSATGDLQWQKSLGGSDSDWGRYVWQTADGGYVMVGETISTDGDITLNDGGIDCWIVKLDTVGEIQWEKTIGGTHRETCLYAQQTSDGGYVATCHTESNDGDVSGFHGGIYDFWVAKLSSEFVGLETVPAQAGHIDIFPNPVNQSISLQISLEEATLSVRIYDPLGREVAWHEIANRGSIDIAHLPNSVYFVKATTLSSKTYVGKIIKE